MKYSVILFAILAVLLISVSAHQRVQAQQKVNQQATKEAKMMNKQQSQALKQDQMKNLKIWRQNLDNEKMRLAKKSKKATKTVAKVTKTVAAKTTKAVAAKAAKTAAAKTNKAVAAKAAKTAAAKTTKKVTKTAVKAAPKASVKAAKKVPTMRFAEKYSTENMVKYTTPKDLKHNNSKTSVVSGLRKSLQSQHRNMASQPINGYGIMMRFAETEKNTKSKTSKAKIESTAQAQEKAKIQEKQKLVMENRAKADKARTISNAKVAAKATLNPNEDAKEQKTEKKKAILQWAKNIKNAMNVNLKMVQILANNPLMKKAAKQNNDKKDFTNLEDKWVLEQRIAKAKQMAQEDINKIASQKKTNMRLGVGKNQVKSQIDKQVNKSKKQKKSSFLQYSKPLSPEEQAKIRMQVKQQDEAYKRAQKMRALKIWRKNLDKAKFAKKQ